MIISKTPKQTWKKVYSAYRALKNTNSSLPEFWEKHTAWLDALEMQRHTLGSGSLSIQPDILCRYAHDKDPFGLEEFTPAEQLKARLLQFKGDKGEQRLAKIRAEFDWENIDTPLCEEADFFAEARLYEELSRDYTQREWECYGRYDAMKHDIDAGLSAYQLVELVARGEFNFSFLGHSRGYEVKRWLP